MEDRVQPIAYKLLAEIIMLLVMTTYHIPYTSSEPWTPETLAWTAHGHLTLVCRKWRTITLSCSVIWADIPFFLLASSPRFEDIFARSRKAPLRLMLEAHYYLGPPPTLKPWESPRIYPIDVAQCQLEKLFDVTRLLDLHWYANDYTQSEVLASFPEDPTPKLRSIILSGSHYDYLLPNDHSPPNHLLTRSRPALRELRLNRFPNPWTLPLGARLLPALSDLHLSNLKPAVPVEIMAAALACSQKLKNIHTHYSLAAIANLPQPTRSHEARQKIHLPLLESLHVEQEDVLPTQFL